jgi:uncharacterized membrane protein YdbT with pleckstrin-like domain
VLEAAFAADSDVESDGREAKADDDNEDEEEKEEEEEEEEETEEENEGTAGRAKARKVLVPLLSLGSNSCMHDTHHKSTREVFIMEFTRSGPRELHSVFGHTRIDRVIPAPTLTVRKSR